MKSFYFFQRCLNSLYLKVIRDYQRGWAWTRALLGVQADEIHVCGEVNSSWQVRSLTQGRWNILAGS